MLNEDVDQAKKSAGNDNEIVATGNKHWIGDREHLSDTEFDPIDRYAKDHHLEPREEHALILSYDAQQGAALNAADDARADARANSVFKSDFETIHSEFEAVIIGIPLGEIGAGLHIPFDFGTKLSIAVYAKGPS